MVGRPDERGSAFPFPALRRRWSTWRTGDGEGSTAAAFRPRGSPARPAPLRCVRAAAGGPCLRAAASASPRFRAKPRAGSSSLTQLPVCVSWEDVGRWPSGEAPLGTPGKIRARAWLGPALEAAAALCFSSCCAPCARSPGTQKHAGPGRAHASPRFPGTRSGSAGTCPASSSGADMNKLSCGKKTRVEGGQLGGDEWTRHGSFVNKPTRGWLHPDDKVMGPGVSYHVRYMGCVEVLQSMRALDFNTRTQVTREAIGLVCEAVPGAKGAVRRRKPCGRSLNSILGKSNLKFAGMPITLTISTSSLNLMASDCKQIIANHHMQSISFASGGDPDTAEYVAYVAKDPVNQRACHILECPEGLAQDVISTIGQAFELRFKQYLKNPPKLVTPHDRMAGFDGSAWDEEEEEPAPDHQYYNDFPGKEPPIGGVVDMRLREGAAQTPNHLGATLPVGQTSGGEYDPRKQHAPAQAGREKYPAAAGAAGRTDLFDDPSYVNVQNVDKARQASAAGAPTTANGSAQRDLFDMKPFEDALRVPPAVPVSLPPAQVVASMEEQLRREPWYHGKMNRKEAEKLLKVNGDFLVRESTTTPGQYVLTGLQGGQPKHLLLVDPEGVVRTKDHRFESVSHLISYHMDNHLPIISAGSEMCLQQPVERRL